MFRRKQLCPGAETCPHAQTEGEGLPCEKCPEQLLCDYLASGAGRMLIEAVDLDAAIHIGIKVSMDELPYSVALLLARLAEQRSKFEMEEMERSKRHN